MYFKKKKFSLVVFRLEILSKLQYAMQSQWNEAVALLAATPQRNVSFCCICSALMALDLKEFTHKCSTAKNVWVLKIILLYSLLRYFPLYSNSHSLLKKCMYEKNVQEFKSTLRAYLEWIAGVTKKLEVNNV